MNEQLDHLEFVVNSLNEVRILLDTWDGIAGAAFRRDDSDFQRSLELVRYCLVGIDIDRGRGPGREVFLVLTAPHDTTEWLFKTLRRLGMNFTKHVDEEEKITRCRLIPVAPHHEQGHR
jgi:hypothetical protein